MAARTGTEPVDTRSDPARPEDERSDPAGSPPGGPAERRRRGGIVEIARFIIVALFAVGGWEVATASGTQRTERLLVGIVLGSGIGYVLGGVFGRKTASAVSDAERALQRVPAADILSGGVGMVVGLAVAALLSIPLFHLPAVASFSTAAFVYAICGYVGYRIGRAKSEELFAMFGVKPRAAGIREGEVSILDTSVLLDARLIRLVQMGFVGGTLVVPRPVLQEVQTIADSSDPARRMRGRKALEAIVAMKRDPASDVVLGEDDLRPGEEVDAQVLRMARRRGAGVLTNDSNMARVAAALDLPVRSLHALADAVRPPVVAGDRIEVRLTRHGQASGQGVGYLEDGTMVVVEDADRLLGESVTVGVTNVLQTSTGRLVFARVEEHQGELGPTIHEGI